MTAVSSRISTPQTAAKTPTPENKGVEAVSADKGKTKAEVEETREPAAKAQAAPVETPKSRATKETAAHAKARFANDPAAAAQMKKIIPQESSAEGARGSTRGKANLSAQNKQKYEENYTTKLPGPITAKPPKGFGADALKTKNLPFVHKHLDAQLKKAFPKGCSFNPAIKPADGAEAAKAKWGLLGIGQRGKATEGDHIVRFGKSTRMMTTRTDSSGKAVATLHAGKGPEIPAASKFAGATEAKRLKAAKKAFAKDFGITVKDKPKKFKAEELEKVHAGLSRLSAKEKEAIKGTELVRTTSISGGAAAHYGSRVTKVKGRYVNKKTMKIADSAFNRDKTRFVGDGTKAGSLFPSSRLAVHEAGHGIEFNRRSDARAARNNAVLDYNSSLKTLRKGPKKSWTKTYKGLSKTDKAAAKKFHSAASKVDKTARSLAKAKSTQVASRLKTYNDAVKARDAALAALAKQTKHPALGSAKALVAGQNTTYKGVATTSTALKKASSADGKTSRQLEKFKQFVADNKVKPFTDYSTKSSAEFYAEAVSLYRTDPQWMQRNSPKLYKYFKANEHLSDFADASAGKAVTALRSAKRPISGDVMMKAIKGGIKDKDKNEAVHEFNVFKEYATQNWSDMSPQAKSRYKIYEKYAKKHQALKRKGIPAAEVTKMLAEMAAVK